METEIAQIVGLLKDTGSFMYPAAMKAATLSAVIAMGIGGVFTLLFGIFGWILYKWDDQEPMWLFFGVFGMFIFSICFLIGIYEYNTLEFQAIKMLLSR
jgi:hypothetical protein